MKNARHQKQGPQKTKRMQLRCCAASSGEEATSIPSEQSFCQATGDDRQRSKPLLKRAAQGSKEPPTSTKQARWENLQCLLRLHQQQKRRSHSPKQCLQSAIASNLLLLASFEWIIADALLIASPSKLFLTNHVKWHQGVDPSAGRPGFVVLHCAARCFLHLEDVQEAEWSWETHELCHVLRLQVAKIDDKNLFEENKLGESDHTQT